MKRSILTIISILFSALLIGCAAKPSVKTENIFVGTFDLADYEHEIEWYKNDFPLAQFGLNAESSLGVASDTATALAKGEAMLIKIYGEDQIKGEYPLHISFDEKNGAWLMHGSLPQNMYGGVAEILFKKEDGKILSIYHGK